MKNWSSNRTWKFSREVGGSKLNQNWNHFFNVTDYMSVDLVCCSFEWFCSVYWSMLIVLFFRRICWSVSSWAPSVATNYPRNVWTAPRNILSSTESPFPVPTPTTSSQSWRSISTRICCHTLRSAAKSLTKWFWLIWELLLKSIPTRKPSLSDIQISVCCFPVQVFVCLIDWSVDWLIGCFSRRCSF